MREIFAPVSNDGKDCLYTIDKEIWEQFKFINKPTGSKCLITLHICLQFSQQKLEYGSNSLLLGMHDASATNGSQVPLLLVSSPCLYISNAFLTQTSHLNATIKRTIWGERSAFLSPRFSLTSGPFLRAFYSATHLLLIEAACTNRKLPVS